MMESGGYLNSSFLSVSENSSIKRHPNFWSKTLIRVGISCPEETQQIYERAKKKSKVEEK
jgi:hypothetical protein